SCRTARMVRRSARRRDLTPAATRLQRDPGGLDAGAGAVVLSLVDIGLRRRAGIDGALAAIVSLGLRPVRLGPSKLSPGLRIRLPGRRRSRRASAWPSRDPRPSWR